MINPRIVHVARLIGTLLWWWVYIPHLLIFFAKWANVKEDIYVKTNVKNRILLPFALIYCLHTSSFFRTLYYYRIGETLNLLIGWYRPGSSHFMIYPQTEIGPGFGFWHPYATIINAKSIGANFRCMQCTTLGAKGKNGELKPIIGNNVVLGANVTIIGDVKIGDNVAIGAGSVVVHDLPSNSVAIGNPARVIKKNE